MKWMAATWVLIVTGGFAQAQATVDASDVPGGADRQAPPGLLPHVDELPAVPAASGNPAHHPSGGRPRSGFHGRSHAYAGRSSRLARGHSGRRHGARSHRASASRVARHPGAHRQRRGLTHRRHHRHHLVLSPGYDGPAGFYGPPPYMVPVYADPF